MQNLTEEPPKTTETASGTPENVHPTSVSIKDDIRRNYAHCKNLKFLVELMAALAITPHAYAKLTYNPVSEAQNLRSQLHKDDMKLSKARRIVDLLGYKLEVSIKDKKTANLITETEGYVVSLPEQVTEAWNETPYINLAFLWSFMMKKRISKRALAKQVNLSPGAVFTWFQADDIAISYLNKIREAYDVRLIFQIEPKQKTFQ